ncbi:MAG TPA: hypothetical protein VN496_02395 [Burkholderiales bacterium]|nr:hypothetical protein [Burkholderiales bacterium]
MRADLEVLGSNNGQYAFQFPLATNHLFQGWADVFLTTPRQGIRDSYLSGGMKIEKMQFLAESLRRGALPAMMVVGRTLIQVKDRRAPRA